MTQSDRSYSRMAWELANRSTLTPGGQSGQILAHHRSITGEQLTGHGSSSSEALRDLAAKIQAWGEEVVDE